MKKLERLTLKDLGKSALVLDQSETIGLKGGEGDLTYWIRYGVILPAGTSYDPMTDTCYPTPDTSSASSNPETSGSQGPCPQCEAFYNHNEHNSLGGVDGENVMMPFGEFIANTLPHMMGWGNHVNGSH